MTQSQKYTLKDVQKEEADWKDLILQNEVTLLGHFSVLGLHYAYDEAEHNAWIVKTLVDKKQRYKFKNCNSIVLVGSGIYPYSMFDLHKQYPHLEYQHKFLNNTRHVDAKLYCHLYNSK